MKRTLNAGLLIATLGLLGACSSPPAPAPAAVKPGVGPIVKQAAVNLDLTTLNASATVGGALLKQSNFDSSTGTGVFESFVRIQNSGTEKGHNTDARPLANNELTSATFTRSLPLSGVPIIQEGGVDYREFRLDINQTASNPLLSLDEIKVFVASSPTLTTSTGNFGAAATQIYDLDSGADRAVLLNYLLAPGSGNGDMVLLIPDAAFPCPDPTTCYVYLWSAFGGEGGSYVSNDGFEEWSVRKLSALAIAKSANATFKRTYTWEIKKSVAPDNWHLFTGDSGTSQYKVEVKRTVTDSDFAVTGTIVVSNNTNGDIFINKPTDLLPTATGITVDCGPVSFPLKLDGAKTTGKGTTPGESLACTYTATMPNSTDPNGTYTNTASVAFGGKQNDITSSASANIDFQFAANEVGPKTIKVDDTNGSSWNFSDSGSVTYNRTFTCDKDKGEHNNTATIVETNQSASAKVTVNCYSLAVSKTANTEITKERRWKIEKSADPTAVNLFQGDTGSVNYAVTVTKEEVAVGWKVSGDITVSNPAPMAATLTGVTDVVSVGINATVTCPSTTVPAKSGSTNGTLVCTYTAGLPDAADRTNTATATLQNKSYDKDGVATNDGTTAFQSPAVDVSFANASVVLTGPATVDVSDTLKGDLEKGLSDSKKYEYSLPVDCSNVTYSGNSGSKNVPNTASLSTGATANASVTVNCYKLAVSKTANTTFTRTYKWDILKSSSTSSLTLQIGQQFLVNYSVKLTSTFADSAWAVSGKITVSNPAPMKAALDSVTDSISGVGGVSVNCPALEVPAGGSLDCTYSSSLPDASSRTNTATANLKNTPSGTTAFTGSASVTFGNTPTAEVDKCVTVTDDKKGTLGTVCANETPKTFNYSLNVGPYSACGQYTYVNTASFTTSTTGATGSSSWTVNVNVPCPGCTLTQGYWKTHSKLGPAPYDSDWGKLGDADGDGVSEEHNENFFKAGMTWHTAFWTPPAGNAFYNLAHQYMAAKLNILNGSSAPSSVTTAMAQAEALFNSLAAVSTALTSTQRRTALNLAATLDQYNNGLIGPGHCSE